MQLEANTVDWATLILKAFDPVENFVRFVLAPASSRSNTVVIVKKLSIWVTFMGPFESFTCEVIDLGEDTRLEQIIMTIIDGFVNDIPGISFVSVSLGCRLNVSLQEVLNL